MRGNDGNSKNQPSNDKYNECDADYNDDDDSLAFNYFDYFYYFLPPLYLIASLFSMHYSIRLFAHSFFMLKHGTLSCYFVRLQKSSCILKSDEIYTEISVIHFTLYAMHCFNCIAYFASLQYSLSHSRSCSLSLLVFQKFDAHSKKLFLNIFKGILVIMFAAMQKERCTYCKCVTNILTVCVCVYLCAYFRCFFRSSFCAFHIQLLEILYRTELCLLCTYIVQFL